MRVLVNAVPARGAGGITYYASRLLQELAHCDFGDQYLAIVADSGPYDGVVATPTMDVKRVEAKDGRLHRRLWWEATALPRLIKQFRADVLFHVAPISPARVVCPTVLQFANMAPFEGEHTGARGGYSARLRLLRYAIKWSVQRLDATIAMSSTAKETLIQGHGFQRERLHAVLPGIDTDGLFGGSLELPSLANGESPPIVYTGHVHRYKRLETLIRGFAEALRRVGSLPDLVIAGDRPDASYAAELDALVHELQVGARVHFLGRVRRDTLGDLLRTCSLFVFMSTVETCPISLIEAMACGAPVLATRASAIPEVGGEGALYFDADDWRGLAGLMASILNNPQELQSLRDLSQGRARQFSWKKCAGEVRSVLAHAAAGK